MIPNSLTLGILFQCKVYVTRERSFLVDIYDCYGVAS